MKRIKFTIKSGASFIEHAVYVPDNATEEQVKAAILDKMYEVRLDAAEYLKDVITDKENDCLQAIYGSCTDEKS